MRIENIEGSDLRFYFRIFVAIAVFAAFGVWAHAQIGTEPLQITLACERASDFTFRLTVHNVSTAPTAAVIGTILGNDKKYLLGSVGFTLTRPGAADVNFDYFDPTVAVVGGRVDPWLVPLPVGASYSVVISIPKGFRDLFSTPVGVRVRLTTQQIGNTNLDVQGLRFIHVWVGTLTSDQISFPNSCRP